MGSFVLEENAVAFREAEAYPSCVASGNTTDC